MVWCPECSTWEAAHPQLVNRESGPTARASPPASWLSPHRGLHAWLSLRPLGAEVKTPHSPPASLPLTKWRHAVLGTGKRPADLSA